MLNIRNGTLKIRGDAAKTSLRVKNLSIGENGILENDGKVYTETTVSSGSILGSGELWAWWVTSEHIGGMIDAAQTIVYYGDRPVESSWIQVMSGSIVVTPPSYRWSFKD